MKQDTLSLRRRHLMIAGLVGIATPAGVFAAQFNPAAPADAPDATLVISGRVVGPDGKPLAGAAIDALTAAGNLPSVSATTDADGRFMFTTTARHAGDRPQSFDCRVSHVAHRALRSRIDLARAHVQRDEAGTLRAAISLRLA